MVLTFLNLRFTAKLAMICAARERAPITIQPAGAPTPAARFRTGPLPRRTSRVRASHRPSSRLRPPWSLRSPSLCDGRAWRERTGTKTVFGAREACRARGQISSVSPPASSRSRQMRVGGRRDARRGRRLEMSPRGAIRFPQAGWPEVRGVQGAQAKGVRADSAHCRGRALLPPDVVPHPRPRPARAPDVGRRLEVGEPRGKPRQGPQALRAAAKGTGRRELVVSRASLDGRLAHRGAGRTPPAGRAGPAELALGATAQNRARARGVPVLRPGRSQGGQHRGSCSRRAC